MKRMIAEQYWKREDGEVIAVGDMNEHHAKNVLEMREKICQISNTLDEIKKDLLH